MKYIFKIILFSFVIIPFYIWEGLVALWTFKSEGIKELSNDYTETVESLYRRAFPRRTKKPRFNLQKTTRF